jgi:hypothetical protein
VKKKITANEVIREADLVTRQAIDRLNTGEALLHNRGFHHYSAAVNNMKVKFEKALSELTEELMKG